MSENLERRIEGWYFYTSTKYKPGLRSGYKLYVSQYKPSSEGYGLVFMHDDFNISAAVVLEEMAKRGEAPACVFLNAASGFLLHTNSNGYDRGMRMDNYDIFDRSYPDFLVEELIPYVIKEHSLSISPNPDMHLVLGGSSGGISSWNIAWFRTDYFRRVYMSSPSFLSMSNGREYPDIIRKYETKPIKVFMDYSEDEPDEYFGSSLAAGEDAFRALRFAGYDMAYRYFPGEGHCSRERDENSLKEVMEFLWKDWKTVPVKPLRNSSRFEALFPANTDWTEDNDSWENQGKKVVNCEEINGRYVAEGNKIFLEKDTKKEVVATLHEEISSLALSSDGWRLYVGGKHFHCIYAMNILQDGKLEGKYIHGVMHTYTDFIYPGVTDFCVDGNDRVFAATECGIQSVRPFGMIDAIAPLPDDLIPEQVQLKCDDKGTVWLCVKSGEKVFRRIVNRKAYGMGDGKPFPEHYYD